MTPRSGKIFQLATYLYSFKDCVSCTYKNGILSVEIAKGDNQKTVTVKPFLIKGSIDKATIPLNGRADYYFLCFKMGDYFISDKYVVNQKVTDKSKLIPLGAGNNDALYGDIKKRLEKSPFGAFATVKKMEGLRAY